MRTSVCSGPARAVESKASRAWRRFASEGPATALVETATWSVHLCTRRAYALPVAPIDPSLKTDLAIGRQTRPIWTEHYRVSIAKSAHCLTKRQSPAHVILARVPSRHRTAIRAAPANRTTRRASLASATRPMALWSWHKMSHRGCVKRQDPPCSTRGFLGRVQRRLLVGDSVLFAAMRLVGPAR